MRSVPSLVATGALVLGLLASCGDGDEAGPAGDAVAVTGGEAPRVVVTTSILGDVVAEVVGDQADVEVIMPLGADPHDFAASARQAEAMERADLLVINGAGFEDALGGVIESAEAAGAPVFDFSEHVDLLVPGGAQEGHDGEGDHEEGSADPHLWTDPARVAAAVAALGQQVAEIDGVDAAAIGTAATGYAERLMVLDAEIEAGLADIPVERRVLVTNHEVLGYFADRYGFEVIGAVIPSLTTGAGASAADIEALADLIRVRDVPAIFGETTQPAELAEALAGEVGDDVDVVALTTESLGGDGSGAETYVGMMKRNAELIGSALA